MSIGCFLGAVHVRQFVLSLVKTVFESGDEGFSLVARRAFRRRCYVFAIFTNHGRGTFSPGIGRRMVWSRAGSSSSSRHS